MGLEQHRAQALTDSRQLFLGLFSQIPPRVGLDHEQPIDLQVRVTVLPHSGNGLIQFPETLEREPLRGDRDDAAIGCRQGIGEQHAQIGRRIDNDEVIALRQALHSLFQAVFPALMGHLLLCIRQQRISCHDVPDIRMLHSFDDGVFSHQHVVHGRHVMYDGAERVCAVALGIEIHQKGVVPFPFQARSQRRGGGGLTHTALLVCNRNNLGHVLCPPIKIYPYVL